MDKQFITYNIIIFLFYLSNHPLCTELSHITFFKFKSLINKISVYILLQSILLQLLLKDWLKRQIYNYKKLNRMTFYTMANLHIIINNCNNNNYTRVSCTLAPPTDMH